MSSSTFSRRYFFLGAAAVAAVGAVPRKAEAAMKPEDLALELRTFVVPGLHPAHHGLRVAQLSDLHVGPQTGESLVRAAISRVNQHDPDLVVLTGDYLTYAKTGVDLMKAQLGGLKAPVVAILGNHDYWVNADGARHALEGHGYCVLRNQFESVTLRGEPFSLIGVDDLWTKHADITKSFAGAPKESRLVLAHIPHTADLLAKLKDPMLVLSGHTHGGQIHVPGLSGALMRTFGQEPYERGRYKVGPVQLYVSRGLGNSGMPIRVDSAPELTIHTLLSPHVPA
jgi:hypothetical protein